MASIAQILKLADAYGEAVGLAQSTVSRQVFGDGKVLGRLACGRDVHTRRAEEAVLWFARRWPREAAWPAEVLRPEIRDRVGA